MRTSPVEVGDHRKKISAWVLFDDPRLNQLLRSAKSTVNFVNSLS